MTRYRSWFKDHFDRLSAFQGTYFVWQVDGLHEAEVLRLSSREPEAWAGSLSLLAQNRGATAKW
ncbi:hypothetical protein HJFPF1_13145 [Paramyrothecium foliicola]|nr:hypothetical protein HJFPF1_13145 [Paramyrothecium foliicola]